MRYFDDSYLKECHYEFFSNIWYFGKQGNQLQIRGSHSQFPDV